MIEGMTTTEQVAWDALDRCKAELKDQVVLMKDKIVGISAQMFALEAEAYERIAKFRRGDVIEYQAEIGYSRPRKMQTRGALVLRYQHSWGEVRPFWTMIKKDMTMGVGSRHSIWIRDSEMETAKKIGTWDFKNGKFVPIAE